MKKELRKDARHNLIVPFNCIITHYSGVEAEVRKYSGSYRDNNLEGSKREHG